MQLWDNDYLVWLYRLLRRCLTMRKCPVQRLRPTTTFQRIGILPNLQVSDLHIIMWSQTSQYMLQLY